MVSRVSPARRVAFEVLRSVERLEGEPVALLRRSDRAGLSARDLDLATEITYGVLRFRNTLDFIIAHHASRPVRKIDETLRVALRIGLYQLLYLDRVPARAAVDESVRIARAFGGHRGAPFVNAVLREALRHPDAPVLPSAEADPLGYLKTTLSHPEWLARRYLERLGLERAISRCLRQNEPPPVYVRISKRLSLADAETELAVPTERVPAVPRCLRAATGRIQKSPPFERGLAIIQDAGAQLIPQLVQASEGDTILDLCAAPGGKTTLLAEKARRGHVLAIDLRHRRTRLVKALAEKLGENNVLAVTADARNPSVSGPFERILLDAPCSSLGTLRRNPDIKWRASEERLRSHAGIQLELLRAAAGVLAPKGRLVYATCSSEPEENEHVIRSFLEAEPGFRTVPVAPALPRAARHMTGEDGFFRTFPERDDTDAYFAAVLTRDRK